LVIHPERGSSSHRVEPSGSLLPEPGELVREPAWNVGSWQKAVWSLLCLAGTLYYACILPYRTIVVARMTDQVIDLYESGFAGQVTVDYLVDVFFVVNMVVRMKWMSASPAAYLRSSFLLDLVALLPLDVVMGLLYGTEGLEYYRLNRMLKLCEVFDYYRGVEEWFEYAEIMVTPAMQRMVRSPEILVTT
jgi:hypothetical protein